MYGITASNSFHTDFVLIRHTVKLNEVLKLNQNFAVKKCIKNLNCIQKLF